MIRNYFKIALRNMLRHKAFSIINIAGLAIGIASCLLLFSVVKYEWSYDRFQPDFKQIYHVVTEDNFADGITYNPGVPFPVLHAMRQDMPQIKSGGLLSSYGSQVSVLGKDQLARSAEKKFIENTGFFFCDPEFFEVFRYNWLSGNPSVLKEPGNTVLTESMARKYFGNADSAMGGYLKLDNELVVKVAGMIQDPPANTDFPLGIVTSLETARHTAHNYFQDDWHSTSSSFEVFVRLAANISPTQINKQFKAFCEKYYPGNANRISSSRRSHFLQPLGDVHFDSRFTNFGTHTTSRAILWTLSVIGLFIIIMACINFINLSTAQAAGRSKEIGVRKVMGGFRRQLFTQVIAETFFIVLISVLLALLLATLCMPFIKNIALINEPLSLLHTDTFLFLSALTIIVVLCAGTYPALVLSGFKPALALKNKITSASIGGISLRRGLVVFQFAISQILIIGTMVAVAQMNFVKNADLGFNREAVLLYNTNADSALLSRQEAFKQRLLQVPGVSSVSFTADPPSSDNGWFTNFAYDHRPDEKFQVGLKIADEDYFRTFGLQFVAGTPFEKSDTMRQVVINETLARSLGVKDPAEAVGKDLRLGSSPWKKITGVVKDFKTRSLRESIKPIVICENKNFYAVTAVKLRSQDVARTKASIEEAWNRFFPEYAFTSSFMDENIAAFYTQENKLELLYKIFAGIAIFISCLGLYGLVSFMALQKTKEIGVRKILGASVKNIIFLFSKEFTFLILIGSVIAVPAAWYLMNHWLQNFTFRIRIGAGIFITALLLSLLVAWIAVGYKSIKAAMAKPVKSLRME